MRKLISALFGSNTSHGLIGDLINDLEESWERRLKYFFAEISQKNK